jgi:hypothetical protein
MKKLLLTTAALLTLSISAASAQETKSYAPYADSEQPRNVYWGDTHLHTNFSPDANLLGNKSLTPADAYRFARGDTIDAHNGMRARLNRPLDFLVVSDHSEYLGLLPMIAANDPVVMADPAGKRWASMLAAGGDDALKAFYEVLEDIGTAKPRLKSKKIQTSAWSTITSTADEYNDPGKFTAFIGYEWTTMPKGENLHRVVIFKDGADKAGQILPFSAFDSENVEDLWRFLDGYEKDTGGNAMAIAHNGNISNGLMFSAKDFEGKPLTQAYAKTRSRWEPLYEVTQYKGDGEAHPKLSPQDEFADFETWDKGNLDATIVKEDWMLKHEYARSALKLGLSLDQQLGANPFKFGMIGSTDAHTSMPAGEENNYWGKMTIYEPNAHRAEHLGMEKGKEGKLFTLTGEDMGASGYAAVWAKENTREAIFEAMQRRETYATSGPRITVRFFGGWDYAINDVHRPNFADIGYAKGVPMGGDLSKAPDGKAPRFIVQAAKDPDGANLDRVQVVKGWLDSDGKTQEKVYDVALADGRKPGAKAASIGSTVDIKNATYTNTIGDAELAIVWTDPDFDPAQRAFYYVRVIEIPTPRWTAYDEKFFDVELDKKRPETVQDRAYTSPIWYTP